MAKHVSRVQSTLCVQPAPLVGVCCIMNTWRGTSASSFIQDSNKHSYDLPHTPTRPLWRVLVYYGYAFGHLGAATRRYDTAWYETPHPSVRPGGVFVCYDGTVTITLTGQPLSTQHCYRSTTANGYNRSYMTQKCVDLKTRWQWEARSQWKGAPLDGPVSLKIALYHGDKRKRDIDNFNKLVFDALTGIVYADDSQVDELVITRAYDKERPRVEVCLTTV